MCKKNNMKKSLLLCYLLSFILIFQIACNSQHGTRVKGTSFYSTAKVPRIDLLRLGQYCIPGMDPIPGRGKAVFIERDADNQEIIQRDSYGRECCVFDFSDAGDFEGIPDGKGIHKVMVVLQACEDSIIYFYEDYCFRILPSDGLSDAEITEFLIRNDWDKPLNMNNCSSRDCSLSTYTIGNLDGNFIDALKMSFPDYVTFEFLLQDTNGNWLIWIKEQEGYAEFSEAVNRSKDHKEADKLIYEYFEKEHVCSCQLIIWPKTGSDFNYEQDTMNVETLDFGPTLHEFKLSHGWVFE